MKHYYFSLLVAALFCCAFSAQMQAQNANWTSLGPNSANSTYYGLGQVTCIAVNPTNANILWAGTPAGGLWKSTDGGATWTTNTDNFANLGIAAILIDPTNPNNMYLGTGDGFLQNAASYGVMKSTNGGATWNAATLPWSPTYGGVNILSMAMSPTNPNTLLVASEVGLYKTINGGTSWSFLQSNAYYDIKYKPGDPNTIYGATKTAIHQSVTGFADYSIVLTVPNSGRLALAVTPASTQVVAAVSTNTSTGSFNGLYVSTNSGASFTLKSSTPNIIGSAADGSSATARGDYNLCISISPASANTIFVGGMNLWKSTNTGTTWALASYYDAGAPPGIPFVHGEMQNLTWNGSNLFVGCGGGIFKTADNGVSFTDLSNNLAIAQMNSVGVSQSDNTFICGLTGNGTKLKGISGTWTDNIGGYGMECFIHPTNASILYGSQPYGKLYRSLDSGASWVDIYANISDHPVGDWKTPFVMDPNSPTTLYAGYDQLYKSSDQGNTWASISPSLTLPGKILQIAVAPSSSSIIYIATESAVFKTVDGGSSWSPAGNISSEYITDLTVDPEDPNVVYGTGSYFSSAMAFKSINGGTSWIGLDSNIPRMPAHCIVVQPNSGGALYMGTDAGVYLLRPGQTNWEFFNPGLPNSSVRDLEIKNSTGKIYAATYGRGLWTSDLAVLAAMTVTPASLNFTANGAPQTITLVTNCNWSIGNLPTWLSVSPSSGAPGTHTLTVTAAANVSLNGRNTTINFTGCTGQITKSVSVTQEGAAPTLTLNPATLNFVANGSSQTFTLVSNCSWTSGALPPWVTMTPASGNAGTFTIMVTASTNNVPDIRSGIINFSGCSGQVTQTLNITQAAGAATLTLNPMSLNYSPLGSTKNVSLTTNCSWSVGTLPSWITISPLSGGAGTVTLTVTTTANTSTDILTANVEFTGCSGQVTQILVVNQAASAPTLTLNPTTLDFIATGETKTFTLTTNCDWSNSSLPSWLSMNPTSGGPGTYAVSVTAVANNSLNALHSTITMSGCNGLYSKLIIVNQAAALPAISIDPTNLNFASTGGSQTFTLSTSCTWVSGTLPSWLTISPSSGLAGVYTVTVTAAANGSTNTLNSAVDFTGCNGQVAQVLDVSQAAAAPASLTINPASLNFMANGGSQTFVLTTNCSWTSGNLPAWLSISPVSGAAGTNTVTVTATANGSVNALTGAINFSGCSGQITQVLNVTQAAAPAALTVNPASLNFAANGGMQTITLVTNCSWSTGTLPSWLTIAPASGAAGTYTVTATATANGSVNGLTGAVNFSGCSGQIVQVLNVTQAAAGTTLTVSPSSLNFTANGGSQTITLTTNCSWTSGNLPAWLSISPASGAAGTYTVTVTATGNGSVNGLTGAVNFSGCNGQIVQALNVTQAAAPATLTVNPASLNFTANGGSQTIILTTNCSWSSGTLPAWLSISPASGAAGTYTVTVTAIANGSVNGLTGVINFNGCNGQIAQTLNVTQAAAAAPALTVSPSSLTFTANGGSQTITLVTNCSWSSGTLPAWLSISPTSGAAGTYTVTVTAAVNGSLNGLTGAVNFSGCNGQIAQVLNVTQAAPAASLTVSPGSLNFMANGGSQTITLVTNCSWSCGTLSPWFNFSPASGLAGTYTITVTANPNTSVNARSGTINFTGCSGQITQSLTVAQVGKTSGLASIEDLKNQVRCFPNPMHDVTNFSITTDKSQDITIEIMSEDGRIVAVMRDIAIKAGDNVIPWGKGNLATGNYLYRCVFEQGIVGGRLVIFD